MQRKAAGSSSRVQHLPRGCRWAELPQERQERWEALGEKDTQRFDRETASVPAPLVIAACRPDHRRLSIHVSRGNATATIDLGARSRSIGCSLSFERQPNPCAGHCRVPIAQLL